MTGAYGSSCLTLVTLALASSGLGAQSFTETERVTVIDLPVELQNKQSTKSLSAEDFVLLLDGNPQTILSFSGVTATDLHPYQTVIYVEPELTAGQQLRASSDLLLEAVEDLLRLGTVDLVIADPEPRYLVRDTGDPEMLGNALAGGVWEAEAGDDIRALRSGFLQAIRDVETEAEVQELAAAAAGEERRRVQERLDLLLSFLAAGGTPGKLRVLLLVGLRFDLDPAGFYGAWTSGDEEPVPSRIDSLGNLEASVRQTAAAVAAYGWITFPVAPAEPESPLLPGLRIGKWRIAGPAGGRIIGLKIVRESERDPELAESYLENGEALLAQGDPAAARGAFKRALHHFHGDPRTAEAQARALVGLAEAEERLGNDDEARTAVDLAAQVDTEVVDERGEVVAVLQDPLASLGIFAKESSGSIINDRDAMGASLEGLTRRARISLQLVGEPTGETLSVAVRSSRPGLTVVGPAWVRFGTAERVATARVRLAMGGDLVEPSHDLDARFERHTEDESSALLEMRLETGDDVATTQNSGEAHCRLTTGTGSADQNTAVIEHELVACTPTEFGLTASRNLSTDAEFLAVLLEHLPSGVWGLTLVEREGPD